MDIKIVSTPLADIYKLVYSKFLDKRGTFQRLFCNYQLEQLKFSIKQINLSKNKKPNTFRGFHYQSKYKEKKIVKVLKGSLIFYAINIDKSSKEYSKSFKLKINENSNFALYISDKFATAYFTTEPNTQILYLMNNFYKPVYAKGINYKDPKFNIKLPRRPKIITKKDLDWNFI